MSDVKIYIPVVEDVMFWCFLFIYKTLEGKFFLRMSFISLIIVIAISGSDLS